MQEMNETIESLQRQLTEKNAALEEQKKVLGDSADVMELITKWQHDYAEAVEKNEIL